MVFEMIADYIVTATGLTGNAADALHFWIYDSLKIITILLLVIFAIGFLRTYLAPEKLRDYLKGKHSIFGYGAAALLGIVSPFCSCSTIPLFLGFVSAGVPFGMIITFLFVSPMVNEAAIVVLLGTLGWKITSLYVLGGVIVGSFGGFLLNNLGFEKYVEKFDFGAQTYCEDETSIKERCNIAYTEAKDIVKQITPYVLIGVGIGALIHGFVPREIITNYLTGSLAVPGAVIVGIPIYTNIMGVIPVIESLIGKGLPVGTSLAFMMSVAALSLPEFIMLKKAMKKQLIIAYGAIVGVGITLMGIIFNFIF
ncbi:permease [Methanohalobium sp.]|uniref:permease n=1 Tax=Methanohalobium sp. TaxID=2837493 RepID=UPI0025E58D61|nr:permease [Methanohalobium sp.]